MSASFFHVDNLLQIIARLNAPPAGLPALVDLANDLSSALGGAFVAMARWHEDPLELGGRITTSQDRHFEDIYVAHFPDRVPWVEASRRHANEFCHLAADYEAVTIERTSFFEEFMKPQGFAPLAVMGSHHRPCEDGPGFGWVVYGRRDFTPEEVRFCRRLDPHLAQACLNAAERLVLDHRIEHMHELMDYAPVGLIHVDMDGSFAWMNRMASRLLHAGEGLEVRDGRLAARDSDTDQTLRHAMTNLIENRRRVQALPIPRAGRLPLGLVLTRRPKAPTLPRGEPIGTIAIMDPERQFSADSDQASAQTAPLLRQLYGLTDAEARLAVAITAGSTPQQVADRSGRSLETVRTQLKGVFRKLGVSRQTDLVRVLSPTLLNQDGAPAARTGQA